MKLTGLSPEKVTELESVFMLFRKLALIHNLKFAIDSALDSHRHSTFPCGLKSRKVLRGTKP